MKRIALIILVLSLWSMETKAQMQQGSWMLEGSAGLERSRSYFPETDEKSNPVSGFTLHPKIGYFVADNLAIGASGLFGNSWNRNKDYDENIPSQFKKSNVFNYGGGLFIRKYIPINEALSFFAEAGSEIFWVKRKSVFNDPLGEIKSLQGRTFSTQGTLGLQYLISAKLGVHMQTNLVQYEQTQSPPDSGNSQSEFQAGFLLNPRFGLTLFL